MFVLVLLFNNVTGYKLGVHEQTGIYCKFEEFTTAWIGCKVYTVDCDLT